MDIIIEQLSQDLARAGYANRTRCEYRKVAEKLGGYFNKPIADISRDELRQYVQTITEQTPSASNLSCQLCALLFSFRRTLGKPQFVSFIKLPRTYSKLPTVLSKGDLDVCQRCGFEHPAYNSCRNRHCPKCQALAQQKWIDQQRQRLLDVPHFHVVFTVPAELRPLSAFAPTVMFGLLFTCAAATLRAFARRRLQAELGITMVLHT